MFACWVHRKSLYFPLSFSVNLKLLSIVHGVIKLLKKKKKVLILKKK